MENSRAEPGTSIGNVFDDAMAEYDYLEKEGQRLLRFGLEVIGSRIDIRGEGSSAPFPNELMIGRWPL